ncbi:uncharacterized protein LACBIDRAFT_308251 [Laccaria bicolor S238N-H82]|uniref:Predicted protein n=1 Tax=Laccaria bicolor (strain S238N-H82 / ATCC MYA-4686) TaxID=486041 RepID=B0DRX7_LACBS|nr:uncharacterized protein LACBIDRAFT_308251 [Laccaria bicolor S238N-H82]EDR02692.1 predicted protein [Laccaria bicolor S238N-H82]|eukprot:XP_001886736.1 predicted protein [Laccaria bicolor S238N-H82]
MEGICYFLVGKLESGRDGAKTATRLYRCLQPSETVAFRTSLSKYFETLRHHSRYPSLKTSLGASAGKAKAKELRTEAESLTTAWWWRDVVVHKSLPEDCFGEKFERLLLSVSMHVLLRGSSTIPPERMSVGSAVDLHRSLG